MPSLSQSPILQALGYAIANSLWQMALVWIVYVLLNGVFKFKSEVKYRIAVAAQITGFAWFLVTLQFYYQQCSQALEVAEALYLQTGDQQTYIIASEKGSLLSYFIKAEQVLPYLSLAYLLLLAFLTIRWFRAYRYTQIVRLNGLHKIDVDWKLFVTKVAGQLGIKQKVRIYLSEIIQSPVTIGFLKPVILIPIASINHLTAQQLEAVILHELAHIKRHDYILNIVLSIIELGLFFNPFTRLITKSISKERENSCDDWVLQYQYNPAMYAEALLRIAVLQKNPAMAMYAVKTKGELLSRVQRMVHQKDSRFNYRHQLLALLLMTGILTSIAWFDPSSLKAQDVKATAENQVVVIEPLAAKVDNPLFNPLSFLNKPLKEEVKKTVEQNHKRLARWKKDLRTADREFEFATVMAPVAIENLKDIEKNIAGMHAVKQDLRRTLMQLPAQIKAAQSQVFYFDSLKSYSGNAAFYNENYWSNWAEELKNSQKTLEEAVKKGQLSKIDARKIQAELADAFRELKEINVPRVWGFAPGTHAGNEFVYKNALAITSADETEREKTVHAEAKRKSANAAAKNNQLKARKDVPDTLRNRHFTRIMPGKTVMAEEVQGYLAMADGAPHIVIDGKSIQQHLKIIAPKGPSIRIEPQQGIRGQGAVSYTYVYTDGEDECEKANKTERSRKVVHTTTTVTGKSTRPVPSKSRRTVTTHNADKSCNQNSTTVQPPLQKEVNVQLREVE